jgi:dihydropteroate synthase
LLLIRNIEAFQDLGCPLYIGTSRKSFLGKILDRHVREREAGTLAANAVAVLGGASVLRVHDVAGARDLVLTLGVFRDGWSPPAGEG